MLLKISADGQYTYNGYIIYKASLWYHIFTISSNGEIPYVRVQARMTTFWKQLNSDKVNRKDQTVREKLSSFLLADNLEAHAKFG